MPNFKYRGNAFTIDSLSYFNVKINRMVETKFALFVAREKNVL